MARWTRRQGDLNLMVENLTLGPRVMAGFDPDLTFMSAAGDGRGGQEADIRSGLFARLTTASRQFVEQQFIRVGRREGV